MASEMLIHCPESEQQYVGDIMAALELNAHRALLEFEAAIAWLEQGTSSRPDVLIGGR